MVIQIKQEANCRPRYGLRQDREQCRSYLQCSQNAYICNSMFVYNRYILRYTPPRYGYP